MGDESAGSHAWSPNHRRHSLGWVFCASGQMPSRIELKAQRTVADILGNP
jgi:hypothetical protein